MFLGTSRARSSWVYIAAAVLAGIAAVAAATLSGSAPSNRAGAAAAAPAPAPLDPLSADEIATTFSVIEASSRFPEGGFFPLVTLKEPPKAEVVAWTPGRPFRREAFANVFDRANNKLWEAVVDLRSRQLLSFTLKPGAQPAVFASEFVDADAAVRDDPRWRQAMRDRGIAPKDVYIDGWAPGDILLPAAPPGARLMRALSFFAGDLPNPYDRPIEGVVATVDMNRLEVVDVVDSGIRPVNKTITGNAPAPRTGLKPLRVVQSEGPSFDIAGNAVSWQGWHFRIGFSPREGLILHQVGYEQAGTVRRIIHRLSLDEIYVPYALPDRNWAWRTAMDVGEYNLGQYLEKLRPRVDVPTNAVFFDEVAPSDLGSAGDPPAFGLDQSIALYERDGGSLWDRSDPSTLEKDARFARELVATATWVIGNYTYTTEYVFRMDGGIDVVAGATGTTLNRGVNSTAQGDEHGTTVVPKIAAPSHQHFFNFRIDFDVDGAANRVVEENIKNVPSQFGNAFDGEESVLGTERFRDTNADTSRHWVVESTTRTNALGEPTAYELEPIDLIRPYSTADFEPLRHAPFAQHPFWVTRYDGAQLYAAGDYPNQGPAGEGLTKYAADKASVDGNDLVVWYTIGHTHEPAIEQYPVMTRETVGFSLRPNGFFDTNPALDAP